MIDPTTVLTQAGDMPSVLDAYETFDRRESGWTKVALDPSTWVRVGRALPRGTGQSTSPRGTTCWHPRRVASAAGWAVTTAGALLVLLVLRDIVHTLWHPSGRRGLSRRLMQAVWQAGRGARHRSAAGFLGGPMAMVVVVLVWIALLVTGWTLVYWPHLPHGFVYGSGLESGRSGVLDAVYLSLVTLATLGFGDIVPESPWLRIAVPVQALVGFVLLTAAVTWVLQVYPALSRRRALALRLSLLGRAALPAADVDAGLVREVAVDLAQVRVDVTQHAETHYFRDVDPETALPLQLPVALALAEAAGRSADPQVRAAAALLGLALEDLTGELDRQFLHRGGDVRARVAAYADDHGHPPDGAGPVRPGDGG
ncbi:ion channel [Geodermatophilus sp. SYSU D01045]